MQETYSKSPSTVDLLDFSSTLKSGKKKKSKKKKLNLAGVQRYYPDYKAGLTTKEVDSRMEAGLVNSNTKPGGKSYLSIIVSNIFTYINMLVFFVFVAMLLVVRIEDWSKFLFVVIILINTVIGIIQECRSKATIDRLKLLTAPSALVVRNGQITPISVKQVVLDDIIYLETGKQIAADAVVIEGVFDVNESMLTGESLPIKKEPGDIIYSGSYVASGSGYARVEKIGELNYIETLSSYAKKYKKPKSEINKSINLIIKIVSLIMIPIAVLMVYMNYNALSMDPHYVGIDPWERGSGIWYEIITTTSGAVIGMIPSGMFLLTTIALAASVIRLASKKTAVHDLNCIEMLARVDTLCLDKTGTITDGSMSVKKVIGIKGGSADVPAEDVIGSMLSATGDNNQTAIALAGRFGYNLKYKAVAVIPFSSQRKLSAVTFEDIGTYVLGAPEFVVGDMGQRLRQIVDENAMQGYRVLCLAHSLTPIKGDKIPSIKRPVCLIVVEDHIREEAPDTIKWFRENDVAVKVISGDNPITVSEVARRAGVENAEKYISLDGLSKQEVIEAANKYTVFGRVSPEQKSILVKSMKNKGHTVAMTGDGVNDILAMRQADCAISIASGAEAARNVSHLVLMDNNFNSMPHVVVEGRRVINNISKSSSLFLMKTLMTIVLSIVSLIVGTKYFFTTNMTMMYELFITAVPSFFLAMQTNKNRLKGNFLSNVLKSCVPGGLTIALALIGVYLYWLLALGNVSTRGDFDSELLTMLTLTLTYGGYFVLLRLCHPYNTYRVVLVIATLLSCVAGTSIQFFYHMFGLDYSAMNLQDLLFIISSVLACYGSAYIMSSAFEKIRFGPQMAEIQPVEMQTSSDEHVSL